MSIQQKKQLIVASPRGFCAGVVRAIETVEKTLNKYGAPVYVLHEIVHNKHVIAYLEQRGAIFVKGLEDIPRGEICIFSAHGVATAVEEEALKYGLRTIDATCPLVSSIHRIVENYSRKNYDIIIIGHHNHPEVVGTAGRVGTKVHIVATVKEAENLTLERPDQCAYVTQTTLSQDDIVQIRNVLISRFPQIQSSKTNTCYATQNRQEAVKRLAKLVDIILVVGSKNSSNSNRLKEVAIESGTPAHLIDDSSDIEGEWFEEVYTVGLTAGASAPENLVSGVIKWISDKWPIKHIELEGEEKKIYFKPADIR